MALAVQRIKKSTKCSWCCYLFCKLVSTLISTCAQLVSNFCSQFHKSAVKLLKLSNLKLFPRIYCSSRRFSKKISRNNLISLSRRSKMILIFKLASKTFQKSMKQAKITLLFCLRRVSYFHCKKKVKVSIVSNTKPSRHQTS